MTARNMIVTDVLNVGIMPENNKNRHVDIINDIHAS